jgi:hypothetical protein
MQICVALHYVDLNYDICVCLLNYVMNLTTVDHFADNSFEYLILLNAYKCVNVVCADATRCNLECPIAFFYPTLALQFGASSEKKYTRTVGNAHRRHGPVHVLLLFRFVICFCFLFLYHFLCLFFLFSFLFLL